jgi:hypothetical protein
LVLLVTSIIGDNGIDCHIEDIVHAAHLLAAALHVSCSHLLCYSHSLLLSHRGQSLGFEEVNAGTFRSEICFETDENERSVRAEVKDLGVPL